MSEVDYLFIQVPQQFTRMPHGWDPKLAYEIGRLKPVGSLALYDWRLERWPVDVLARDLKAVKAGKIIVWTDYRGYPYAHALATRILDENVVIMGLSPQSRKHKSEACVFDRGPRRLPLPDHSLFVTWDGYWSNNNSALPLTGDTMMWRARIPMRFRTPKKAVPPERAAETMLHLKQRWWFDSAEILDDMAADAEWTLKLLKEMDRLRLDFPWTCLASPDRLDEGLVVRLRDTGCKVIDLGTQQISSIRDPASYERLQGAVMACEKSNVKPTWTWVLDPDAELSDCRAALGFGLAHGWVQRPRLHIDYRIATLKWMEEHLQEKANNTRFSDLELQGVLGAMERGNHKALGGPG